MDSSLWSESDLVVKVFVTMLAKKDLDDIVRGSAFQIGKWANKTEVEVMEALAVLATPDTKRVEPQPFDGRRIEKVEDGWLVLNGEKYRKEMMVANIREYKKLKQREYRSPEYRSKGKPLPGEEKYVKAEANGASETQLDKIVEKHLPEPVPEWRTDR